MELKKIGILTFHNACNYGAFLQAKALRDRIGMYPGIKVYFIDYRNRNIESSYSLFNLQGGLKKAVLRMLRLKDILKRNFVFKQYQEETFEYIAFRKKEQLQNLDKVVVGSDQVWGMHLTGNDENYFLPFIVPEKRVSYAASVGRVEENFPVDLFKKHLEEFSAVSVREKELFDKLIDVLPGLTLCIDPVFLKSKAEWLEYADTNAVPVESYLLIFIMGTTKQADYLVDRAIQIAKEKGYKAILLGDQERWYKYRKVEHYGIATPREFIKLINHAKCVFTNSFHAVAFSILLNTPFYIEMNIQNRGRLNTLLQLADLEERKMYDGKLAADYSENINWENVLSRLTPEIIKSCEYIEKNIIR